jgi:Ca2+-binding RTX toxin-like protein
MMRRSLLALALLLAAPATADAATVTAAGDPPAIEFQAAPGEANSVDIQEVIVPERAIAVSDAGAPVISDGSCAEGPPLLCPIVPVVARLGDRDDRASVITVSDTATVYGDDGDDDILSSGFAGYAYGGAGDDRIRVNSGTEAIGYGGAGNDTIHTGSASNASAFGESGNDVLIQDTAVRVLLDGGSGNDVLVGLPNAFGPAEAHGGTGNDVLAVASTGGSGRVARWTLTGDTGSDVIAGGLGADTIDGGAGGDILYAAGGGADTVSCGSGFDIVFADPDDTVADDCEWHIAASGSTPAAPQVTSALRVARSRR